MSVTRIGDYRVTRELGQGGMGRVFEGLSPQGATVAIKTMLLAEGLSPRTRWETVERFQREARAARSLIHPDIVQVLDIGADQDTFFIVMEYLDGESLRELLDRAGRLEVGRAVEMVTSACEALAYAHDQGIVHRDIKPENIMVLREGAVKLTDFGLASIVTEKSVTQTGTVMGTFFYMSPEQVRGEKLDARSDIFSLGATFYEMVAGRRPFSGETPAVILNKILKEDPPPVVGLPPHVSRVLSRCLRKQPDYRFRNAREIIAGLKTSEAMVEMGTAILPGGPGAPAKAAGVAPGVQVSLTAPPPVFRCSQCAEPMSRTAPSCWKCGTPNSLISMRTQQVKRQQVIEDALKGLGPGAGKGSRGKKRR
jgi:serine/threonine protein kinase